MKTLLTVLLLVVAVSNISAQERKTTNKTIQLEKGIVLVKEIDNVKIHTYQTKDLMNDVVIVLEKDNEAIMLESPAFWDNFEEFRTYLSSNNINV